MARANGKKPTRQFKLRIIEQEVCKEVMAGFDLILDAAYRIALSKRSRRLRRNRPK